MKSEVKVIIILGSILFISIIIIGLLIYFSFYFSKKMDKYKRIREKNNMFKTPKFSTSPQVLYTVILGNNKDRIKNITEFSKQLKQPLEEWPAIYTKPCPTRITKHFKRGQAERGLLLAHQQIWQRFINSPYNIVVIFEDDVIVSSPYSIEHMHKELKNLKVDLLYLGHCSAVYFHKGAPWCTHAYALTKKGAQILLDNSDNCTSYAVDDYMHLLTIDKKIDWNVVENPPLEKNNQPTRGLFHQLQSKSTMG